jgi:hypothetical protein
MQEMGLGHNVLRNLGGPFAELYNNINKTVFSADRLKNALSTAGVDVKLSDIKNDLELIKSGGEGAADAVERLKVKLSEAQTTKINQIADAFKIPEDQRDKFTKMMRTFASSTGEVTVKERELKTSVENTNSAFINAENVMSGTAAKQVTLAQGMTALT